MKRVYPIDGARAIASHSLTLEGALKMPGITITDGVLKIDDGLDRDKLIDLGRKFVSVASLTSTTNNFMAGDFWLHIGRRFGDKQQFLVDAFGADQADRMRAYFAAKAVISKAVPPDDRDPEKSWNWYKRNYQRRTPSRVRQDLRPKRQMVDDDGKVADVSISVNVQFTSVFIPNTIGPTVLHIATEKLRDDLQACEKKPVPVDSGLDEFVKEDAALERKLRGFRAG